MRSLALHGHRGARGLAPENTLNGFGRALAIGVDVLELDVGITADGVVVVTHDPELNPNITRDADGSWLNQVGPPIRTLSRADLLRYDVGRIRPGSAYAAAFPEQTPHDGARIPTLAEVIACDKLICFNIELKTFPARAGLTVPGSMLAEAVAGVAVAGGAAARVIVQSFDWRGLRTLQRHYPEIALAWLTSAATTAAAGLWWDLTGPVPTAPRAVAAAGGETWAPAYQDLTEPLLAEARALGLRVVPWTVNQPSDMARLIAWGVDGLITDRPDLARVALAAAGLALPVPR